MSDAIAKRLGIIEVEADVLLEKNAEVVAKFQAHCHVVAMAGDGVNNAPAFPAADARIAMVTGTDVVI